MATKTRRKPSATKNRVDTYQAVTDEIIAALESGLVPWHRPWSLTSGPTSLSTGKPYRGINVFLLGYKAQAKGYTSRWWGTFNQVQERAVATARKEGREIIEKTNGRGGRYYVELIDGVEEFFRGGVRKGEKGTTVVFWKFIEKKDEKGNVIPNERIPMLRYFTVFNADQCDGLDIPEDELHEHDPIESCEAIRDGYLSRALGLQLHHGGNSAYYAPMLDVVQMPPLNSFDTPEHYYGTLFHEFAHSTGHESRLNRKDAMFNPFGSPDYSKEELVAEMTAAFICGEADIDVNVPNKAAYIEHWLGKLRGDKKLLVSAAGAAQKAADLILGPPDGAEEDEEDA
jgi:antirestriction protein ArdC